MSVTIVDPDDDWLTGPEGWKAREEAMGKIVNAVIQKMQAEAVEEFKRKLLDRLEESRRECEELADSVFKQGEMYAYDRVLGCLESPQLMGEK